MNIKSTRETRLSKYSSLSLNKKAGVLCPVCNASFPSRYSLSNHFLIRGYKEGVRYIDEAHEQFFIRAKEERKKKHLEEVRNRTYEKKCVRCGKTYVVDYPQRFQKKCQSCRDQYPAKIKIPTGKTKKSECIVCGREMEVKLHSSKHICMECIKKKEKDRKASILSTPVLIPCIRCGAQITYYKKHLRDRTCRKLCQACENDPHPFKKDPKYNRVMYLLMTTDLTRRDIKTLLSLETDYVREAALEKFGAEWYKKRVKDIRHRASCQIHFNCSSGLEKAFSSGLSAEFKENQWEILCVCGKMRRCEIDVIVSVKDQHKFAIFIDGESFHGPDSYFGKDRFEREVELTRTLAKNGYYTIRYSETEVKNGSANAHFDQKYKEFVNNPPSYYYRNWATEEEEIH